MNIRLLLLSFTIFTSSLVFSQSVLEQMTRQQPDCNVVLKNATDVLPKLYNTQLLDSVQKGIRILELYCGDEAEIKGELLCLTTLMHIQQSAFSINEISEDYRLNEFLYGYYIRTSSGRKLVRYSRFFYRLLQTWARTLLDKPGLSSTEIFICHVLAGDYRSAERTLKQERKQYPELYALFQKNNMKQRTTGGIVNLMAGVWLPTGNLKILGPHPSLGVQLGGRGVKNELLGTLQIRFLKSAHLYTVYRQDSLYRLNYFLDGYLGLDYYHYFHQTIHTEAGVLFGVGYNELNLTTANEGEKGYFTPAAIGSLNLNSGLRFNYFFKPGLSLGIIARYNAIWYKNTGGSNLRGQPVSIDLVFGR